MFWLRNKKNNFQLRTLIWGPVQGLNQYLGMYQWNIKKKTINKCKELTMLSSDSNNSKNSLNKLSKVVYMLLKVDD